MNYIVFSVRMTHELIRKLHIADSGLVCTSSNLLERREPAEQFPDHGFISFFRKKVVHIKENRLF